MRGYGVDGPFGMTSLIESSFRGTRVFAAALALVVGAGFLLPPILHAQTLEDSQATGGSIMEQRCSDEVVQLHQFFQDWFNARFLLMMSG